MNFLGIRFVGFCVRGPVGFARADLSVLLGRTGQFLRARSRGAQCL